MRRTEALQGVRTGTNCTATTIEQTRAAKADGADAVLVVTPYDNKPTQEGLYRHFAAVEEAVDLPIILYNVAARSGGWRPLVARVTIARRRGAPENRRAAAVTVWSLKGVQNR